MKFRRVLFNNLTGLLAGLLFFTACSQPASSDLPGTPTMPTAQVLTVALTQQTSSLVNVLNRCAALQSRIALAVDLTSANQLDESEAQLALYLGPPPAAWDFSAQLATEEIKVIVNPDNQVKELSTEQLQALWTGNSQTWQSLNGEDRDVQIWTYLAGDEIRQVFYNAILGASQVNSLAHLAADPQDMIAGVAADPGAIGYLPRSDLDDSVRPVNLPAPLVRLLTQPLLALAHQEPQGNARQFLYCLQSGLGRDLLQSIYPP